MLDSDSNTSWTSWFRFWFQEKNKKSGFGINSGSGIGMEHHCKVVIWHAGCSWRPLISDMQQCTCKSISLRICFQYSFVRKCTYIRMSFQPAEYLLFIAEKFWTMNISGFISDQIVYIPYHHMLGFCHLLSSGFPCTPSPGPLDGWWAGQQECPSLLVLQLVL